MWRRRLCNTFACVNCSVADHESADKCSKMALFKQSLIFFFFFLKRLLWTFIRSAERTRCLRSAFLTVELNAQQKCRSKLDLYCRQVKLWMDLPISCTYVKMCKVMNQSAPYQKKISSCLVIFWSAMQFFLHYFFRIVFLFCCNPQYKLVLLLEKYLFLCKYPRGYFVSKCQDTVKNCLWFLKE